VIGPLQFVQGLLAVLLARYVGNVTGAGLVVVGILAVVGNGWSLFLRFDADAGWPSRTGAVAGLNPIALAVLLVGFAAGALRGRIAEGVLAGFIVLPFAGLILAITPVGPAGRYPSGWWSSSF